MTQKRVLASWLRERTTLGPRWLSEHLRMGDESGVSMGISTRLENLAGSQVENVARINKSNGSSGLRSGWGTP
jgi:hypothetical protein